MFITNSAPFTNNESDFQTRFELRNPPKRAIPRYRITRHSLKFSFCKVNCNSSKTTLSDSSLVQHISGTKCLTLYGRVVYPARARSQISEWGPEDKTIHWSFSYYQVYIKKPSKLNQNYTIQNLQSGRGPWLFKPLTAPPQNT